MSCLFLRRGEFREVDDEKFSLAIHRLGVGIVVSKESLDGGIKLELALREALSTEKLDRIESSKTFLHFEVP